MRHHVYALLSLPLSWYILQVFSKPLFDEARNQKRDSESGNIVKDLLFRLRPIFLVSDWCDCTLFTIYEN